MQDYRNLAVWQKAHALALEICTLAYPQSETYGLRNWIRRVALNIPSQIAEGSGSVSDQAFYSCLSVATGEASQLDYLLLVSKDLKFIEPATQERLAATAIEVKKMISGLMKTLRF